MSTFTNTANAAADDASTTKDLAWRLYKSRHYAEAVDAFTNTIESCGGVEADAWAGRRTGMLWLMRNSKPASMKMPYKRVNPQQIMCQIR
eukprot:gene14219-10164_t